MVRYKRVKMGRASPLSVASSFGLQWERQLLMLGASKTAVMKAFHLILASLSSVFIAHAAEPRSPELMALDRYVGNWETSGASGRLSTTCEWILDGSFLRHSWSAEAPGGGPKSFGMQLMSYDAEHHIYRAWTFFSNGKARQGEGAWDAASKTFTWTSKDPENGQTGVTKVTFVTDDEQKCVFTLTDRDGKLITDYTIKKVRLK